MHRLQQRKCRWLCRQRCWVVEASDKLEHVACYMIAGESNGERTALGCVMPLAERRRLWKTGPRPKCLVFCAPDCSVAFLITRTRIDSYARLAPLGVPEAPHSFAQCASLRKHAHARAYHIMSAACQLPSK
jgi:hypothetical protein